LAIPRPREAGLRRGEIFLAAPYYSQRAVLASPPSAFFIRCVSMTAEFDARAVDGDDEVYACTRAQRGAFRLHVGHLHEPVLPAAVLRSDTRLQRSRRKRENVSP